MESFFFSFFWKKISKYFFWEIFLNFFFNFFQKQKRAI